jgi:hypothetical protein
VFHTTKLFDSGFPKVSEDIFQFFGLLLFLSLQKGVVVYFFNLARKFFVFFSKIPNGNTPKKKNYYNKKKKKKKPDSCLPWRPLLCSASNAVFLFFSYF